MSDSVIFCSEGEGRFSGHPFKADVSRVYIHQIRVDRTRQVQQLQNSFLHGRK